MKYLGNLYGRIAGKTFLLDGMSKYVKRIELEHEDLLEALKREHVPEVSKEEFDAYGFSRHADNCPVCQLIRMVSE